MNPHTEINYNYSIFILVNFLGASLALMKKNAYPSIVFVGDTFCYFAGIVIAISSMLSTLFIDFRLNSDNVSSFVHPSVDQLFILFPATDWDLRLSET